MDTPVLYIVFNRPDLVKHSFQKIREAKPTHLFISADGPRREVAEDLIKCIEVKNFVSNNIDWECETKFLYQEKNLGCGKAVSEAITWFFENVEYGIILEDDCIPDYNFFVFCKELLERYKNDEKIFHISGSNWQLGRKRGMADYYFSNFPAVWGWATWSNRWKKYELDIVNSQRMKLVSDYLNTSNRITTSEKEYHLNCFKLCEDRDIDTWDYQWRFLIHLSGGLSITPNRNLVTNIGHREDGTHTTDCDHWRANLPSEKIKFPLNHPKKIKINYKADKFLINKLIGPKKSIFAERIKTFVRKFL